MLVLLTMITTQISFADVNPVAKIEGQIISIFFQKDRATFEFELCSLGHYYYNTNIGPIAATSRSVLSTRKLLECNNLIKPNLNANFLDIRKKVIAARKLARAGSRRNVQNYFASVFYEGNTRNIKAGRRTFSELRFDPENAEVIVPVFYRSGKNDEVIDLETFIEGLRVIVEYSAEEIAQKLEWSTKTKFVYLK